MAERRGSRAEGEVTVTGRPVLNEMMLGMSQQIRVTQLFDCADVAKTFVGEARRRGKQRNLIRGPWTRGGTKVESYRFRLERTRLLCHGG
jgi:hypothetical protein